MPPSHCLFDHKTDDKYIRVYVDNIIHLVHYPKVDMDALNLTHHLEIRWQLQWLPHLLCGQLVEPRNRV